MTDHKIYVIAGYSPTGNWLVCWCHTQAEAVIRHNILTQAMNKYKICLRDLRNEQKPEALAELHKLDATMKLGEKSYVSYYKIFILSDDNTVATNQVSVLDFLEF